MPVMGLVHSARGRVFANMTVERDGEEDNEKIADCARGPLGRETVKSVVAVTLELLRLRNGEVSKDRELGLNCCRLGAGSDTCFITPVSLLYTILSCEIGSYRICFGDFFVKEAGENRFEEKAENSLLSPDIVRKEVISRNGIRRRAIRGAAGLSPQSETN